MKICLFWIINKFPFAGIKTEPDLWIYINGIIIQLKNIILYSYLLISLSISFYSLLLKYMLSLMIVNKIW
jgi:hypothetical protein